MLFVFACRIKLVNSSEKHALLVAGTQISDIMLDLATAGLQTVKGFATIDNVALINVEVWILCHTSHLKRPLQHNHDL